MPAKRISQATFDEVVKANIDDFSMEPDEAIQSAVDEFESQGFDLTTIIRTLDGADISKHAIAVATHGVQISLEDNIQEAQTNLQQLLTCLTEEEDGSKLAVLLKAGTVGVVLGAVQKSLTTNGGSAGRVGQAGVLAEALRALSPALASDDLRQAFLDAGGPDTLLQVLQQAATPGAEAAEGDSEDVARLAAAAVAAAARKEEEAKCRFMDNGTASALVSLLRVPDSSPAALVAAAEALWALVTADDMRPPSSKAFIHARALARDDSAVTVLHGVLRRRQADADVAAAALGTLRGLVANDEICRQFEEEGGVRTCMEVLQASGSNADVAAAACGALRQLANSDVIKKAVAEQGGIELIISTLSAHAARDDVLEAALGLLANVLLRMPDLARQAAAEGAAEAVLAAMAAPGAAPGPRYGPGPGAVQRQGCMALRNMVARCTELRGPLLALGAEAKLRAAKKAYPGKCGDVGAAALRDLGLEDYNA